MIIFLLVSFVSTESLAQKRQKSKSKITTTVKSNTRKPQSSQEAKRQQEAAQKEIKLTEAEIQQNEAKVKKGLSELGKLEQSINLSNQKIKDINNKLSTLKKEIGTLEKNIEKNEEDLEKLRSEYLKAVKKMRVTKKNKSTLAFIFSSKSVNQAMRRMRYLREFSNWREKQSEEITKKNLILKNQKEELSIAQEEEAASLAQQKKVYAELASQHQSQETIVNDLKKNGEYLKTHLKRKKEEANELGNMVSLLIAEEQRKKEEELQKKKAMEEEARKAELAREEKNRMEENQKQQQISQAKTTDNPNGNKIENSKDLGKDNSSKKTNNSDYANARKRNPRSKPQTPPSSDHNINITNQTVDFASSKGKLPYPTSGSFTITSSFGRQNLLDLPDVEFDNPGIDAETEAGATARAVYKGKVSGVYLLDGYNTVVIVNHDGYYTVYGNISSTSVKNGDMVEMGENLGRLTINEEDPNHSSIHFEIWKNREKLNPQEWLR